MNILKRFCLWILCLLPLLAGAQSVDLQGTVKDTKGEPLLGVFILVKGTQRGATTDFDGNYSLQANVGDVLKFSFLGLKTVEKKVAAGVTHINITMEDDVQELEGTVVTGYGGKKIASRTVASVATVQGKEFAQTPNANAIDALQGKVAGMVVTTNSGKPGASSEVLIHGLNSFTSAFGNLISDKISMSPLYVLDGVPLFTPNDGSKIYRDVMTMINPTDIESITVLKDAASTSIYGARAANGVILITTKKGKRDERARISINHQLGFTTLTNVTNKFFNDLASPKEYMDFFVKKEPSEITKLGRRLGYTETTPEAITDRILAENPHNTRWDKVFFRDFVPLSRTDISASGGSRNTTYYLSLGYFQQEGMQRNTDYKRYNANLNLDTEITSWLRTGISASLGHNETEGGSSGFENKVLALPFYTPTDSNGKRKDFIKSILDIRANRNGFFHPDYLAENYFSKTFGDDIMPIAYLSIEPIKNLTFKTQVGIQYSVTEIEDKGPLPSFIDYKNGGKTNASVSRNINKSISRTYTNQLEYRYNYLNKHDFTFLLGQESIENEVKGFNASAKGQVTDALMMLSQGTNQLSVGDNKAVSTFNSYFTRVEYSYKYRYFLDISGRRDGSSAFSANNRYQNFWALGGMWKIKKESFLEKVDWLSSLDLRFSTGISGNSRIGDYRNMILAEPSSNVIYNGQMSFILDSRSLGNPNLNWEEQQKTTLGLNVELARNINFNIEFYNRMTYKILSSRNINSTIGYSIIPDNIGSMQNRGFDFTFSALAYKNNANNITVRPYFNMNYNEQRITKVGHGRSFIINKDQYMGLKEGKPIEWVMPIFKRVNDEGDAEWYEAGNDRLELQKDDTKVTKVFNEVALVQTTGKKRYAPINGGFGAYFTYKDFSLDMSFSYSLGKYQINYDKVTLLNPGHFGVSNFSKKLLNYWKQPGDDTEIPKLSSDYLLRYDTRVLENASFLRMKNINLSYQLPQDVIKQMNFFSSLRLFISARNIFTITKYTGADPELDTRMATGSYPPTRQYTMGIELKF